MFPAEKYRAAGGKFKSNAYATDSKLPVGNMEEAWEARRLRAAKILTGIPPEVTADEGNREEDVDPLPCRFHDLRHTPVSRMLDAGNPIAKVAKIVG